MRHWCTWACDQTREAAAAASRGGLLLHQAHFSELHLHFELGHSNLSFFNLERIGVALGQQLDLPEGLVTVLWCWPTVTLVTLTKSSDHRTCVTVLAHDGIKDVCVCNMMPLPCQSCIMSRIMS